MKKTLKPFVVTTSHRDVLYGYADPKEVAAATGHVRVERARICHYWATTKGITELAATGPGAGAKIGAAAPAAVVRDVVVCYECSPEAEAAFGRSGWAR